MASPRTQEEPKFVITGGTKLSGHVTISGAKNSALPILAATICCMGSSTLRNIPNLSDTRAMVPILESLGAEVDVNTDGEYLVNTDAVRFSEPCPDKVGKLRGGFFVIGALLGRLGEAVVALPGGCDIGARPVDLHIRGLRALGATVEIRNGKVQARVTNGKRLIGGSFRLDYPSVGATETLMMAACIADGVTVLSNVAKEPEVIDLARFLRRSGAYIEGEGTEYLTIKGRSLLQGCEYSIIPDRIEAGTFMLAAAITRSCISMSPVVPAHLGSLIDKLLGAGCRIKQLSHDMLEISAVPDEISSFLTGFDIKTGPFPGFPTDLQPQTMAFLMTCSGLSVVDESVFENRIGHAKELQKFGSVIQVRQNSALIYGKEQRSFLYGCRVTAFDLRGGASLVLAALAANGVTEICDISHIDRVYEYLEKKFNLLGAHIKRSS